jgi:charged multivesicular body protein 6
MDGTDEFDLKKKEVSEMIGGRISNQDEDEVEAELEALAAEMSGKTKVAREEELPSVPDTRLPERQHEEPTGQEQTKVPERREAMLA